jgi:hypothetical protein
MARVPGVDAPKLRQLLRKQLEQRLAQDGWSVVKSDPAVLVTFARPFDDAFGAIAEVLAVSRVPDRPPVQITNLVVGVSYEPLLRLYAELGEDWGRSALDDPITVGEPPRWRISINTPRDAEAAAEELASLVREHDVAFAGRYATFDALLAEHRGEESNEFGVMVPLLLAAAGRVGEARDALAQHTPHDPEHVPDEATLVRKLDAWLRGQAQNGQ